MAGEWNEFKKWLCSEKLYVKKDESGKPRTHLLLDGGMLSVPSEKEELFMVKYAQAIDRNVPLYVVEMKTKPYFRMMAELDIKMVEAELSMAQIILLVTLLQQRVMSVLYTKENIEVAVCTAPAKEAGETEEGKKIMQSGIHLIWKNVIVDTENAWRIRGYMLRAIKEEMKELPIFGDWEEAFDPCVYKENGLRMIFSRKCMICSACQGKSYRATCADFDAWGTACNNCHNRGRLDLGRPYCLLAVLDSEGNNRNTEPQNTLNTVKLTSIRAPADTTTQTPIYIDDVMIDNQVMMEVRSQKRRKQSPEVRAKTAGVTDGTKKRSAPDQSSDLEEIYYDDPRFAVIDKILRELYNFNKQITHIRHEKSPQGCYIINTNSHYCLNKRAEHGSSCVYYILRVEGCVQKCFCPKKYNGIECCKYTSMPVKLGADYMKQLYANKHIQKDIKRCKVQDMFKHMFKEIHRQPASVGIMLPKLKEGSTTSIVINQETGTTYQSRTTTEPKKSRNGELSKKLDEVLAYLNSKDFSLFKKNRIR